MNPTILSTRMDTILQCKIGFSSHGTSFTSHQLHCLGILVHGYRLHEAFKAAALTLGKYCGTNIISLGPALHFLNICQLTGVPNPVTASHPFTAGKPLVPHPVAAPLRTSVKALYPRLYSHRFKKPSGFFPAARSESVTNDKIAAAAGVLAEVPSRRRIVPFQTVWNN